MSGDQWFRLIVGAACTLAMIGCLSEMAYGPRRGMTWAQFLRYAGFAVVLGTVLVGQVTHRNLPITGYTVAFGAGAILGSLGVSPKLKRPMLKPTRSPSDDHARR